MTGSEAERTITTSSIVTAAKGQVSSDLAGEVVLLSLETGMYYGLDQVGVRVWELMKDPVRVADLCAAIVREYDVEAEQCERDVLELVHQMATAGLIEVKGDQQG